MKQYKDLIRHILKNGILKDDRTGVGTLSVFGIQMRFQLENEFPLLTTKKVHFKSVVHELLWFLNGDTNIKYLKNNNVTIWDEWADENGNLGPIYGKQWRKWNDDIDQISNVINLLKKDPNSRRIIVNSWNVSDLNKMSLCPCHVLFQFYTSKKNNSNKLDLSCHLYQRSLDVCLGVPFNIASYALLTMMIAHCVDMNPGELIISGGDAHIYKNHIDGANLILQRTPKKPPTLKIKNNEKNIFNFKYEDFILENYDSYPHIKFEVAV